MKLGVSEEGTVLNECAKFQKKLPYGSRGCHWLQWHKNNNNTYNNNRFPPDGGTLNIAAGSNGGFLLNIPIITKLTWHWHVFHTCTQHWTDNWINGWFEVIFFKLFTNCHCREISMLVTLWVLETFLFPMSNKSWVPSFRHFGLTGLKCHPFESDNFEACSVRPPVLWSGP